MNWTFAPIDRAAAIQVAGWRYDPPYEVYNIDGSQQEIIADLTDPQYAYHVLFEPDGSIAAFCCFGIDARVPGGDYALDALDLGMGVRPDLTGRGLGEQFARAVLDFAQRTYAPRAFRVTIAVFNLRAQHVWTKLGFTAVHTFKAQHSGRPFVILVRLARSQGFSSTPETL